MENDGPSPQLPNSTNPSQPLRSRRCAWRASAAWSIEPAVAIGVVAAAHNPVIGSGIVVSCGKRSDASLPLNLDCGQPRACLGFRPC